MKLQTEIIFGSKIGLIHYIQETFVHHEKIIRQPETVRTEANANRAEELVQISLKNCVGHCNSE